MYKPLSIDSGFIMAGRSIMDVNVLGTNYKVIITSEEDKPKLRECDGYMDPSTKEIVVGKFNTDLMSVDNLKAYTKKVMRHEIIHAFLYESGLWNNSCKTKAWAQSEEMTDWIAIQFSKILDVFVQCDCI